MAYPNHKNKTVVEYKCYGDYPHIYELHGHPLIKCQENGFWSKQNFTCNLKVKKLERFNVQRPSEKSENKNSTTITADQRNYKSVIIITSFLVIILIIVIISVYVRYVAKRKQKIDVNGSKHQVDAEVPESLEILSKDNKDICGRKFPVGIVKDWSDITIHKEVGKGSFCKVYQAYLHLNEVQR